jgi:hypothetical protein
VASSFREPRLVLITATEFGALDADEPLTILDVRWQLAEPDGRAAYKRATSWRGVCVP